MPEALRGERSAVAATGDSPCHRQVVDETDPQESRNHRLLGYLVAIGSTVALLLLRIGLGPLVEATSVFLFFAPAVMASAWYGGRGPGLVATIAGAAAANYFLLVPTGRFSNTPDDLARMLVFLIVGAQISWLSGALHSAKRRAESDAVAARRSEQLYRTLAQNFPNGAVFLLDNASRIALAEGRALASAGISGEGVRGMRLSGAFPRQVLRDVLPLLRSPIGGSTELNFGGRVYLVQVLPLRGTAGQRFAGMGIAQDITELATARAALQAAHDQLEVRIAQRTAELQFQTALLEAQSNASLDGILVASDDGRVIFRNRRLAELWGLPDAAFAGTRDEAVVAMRGVLARPQDPLGGGADVDAPLVELPANLDLRDGRTLECYGAPVAGPQGQYHGRAWYFRDVTERRSTARQILEAGERERHRIGQDLHDDLCQQLTGIACLGRVLHQRLVARLASEADAANQVVDLVEQATRRARDIARGLQPLELEAGGLTAALRELAANIEQMFGIRCHVGSDAPVALDDPACSIQLYRITQEAISNAIRHGKAGNVYVDLVQVGGRVILTIEDDGVGFDQATSARGLGVRTMRHRARTIGATLSMEPSDAGGTTVTCTLASRSTGTVLSQLGVGDAA
jgi:signal transduction histidine kinase